MGALLSIFEATCAMIAGDPSLSPGDSGSEAPVLEIAERWSPGKGGSLAQLRFRDVERLTVIIIYRR